MSARDERKERGRPSVEITLPAHVLMALDALARDAGVSRSGMVAQLVREELRRAVDA